MGCDEADEVILLSPLYLDMGWHQAANRTAVMLFDFRRSCMVICTSFSISKKHVTVPMVYIGMTLLVP